MNIIITGRHISVSDSLREYAEKKIEKLERYFNQLIDAHVIMAVVKLDHITEVIVNGDGVQFHGKETAADLYSSIDLLFEKMEKQIRRYKEKHSAHKGPSKAEMATVNVTSEMGMDVVLRQVSNKPKDSVEAFLEMRVDNQDFILFKKGISKINTDTDYLNKNYAVIYKETDAVKMIEVPFKKKKGKKNDNSAFIQYDLKIINDSLSKPEIKFKKSSKCSITKMTMDEALKKIEDTGAGFLPFYNTDSQYLNIIYRNGKNYEVMVPAF